MTTVFVGTIMTMVFICTRINIVYLCIIINYYFGVVFYINMCIVYTKISFYFTPRNQFKNAGLFCSKTDNHFVQRPITGETSPVLPSNRPANRYWPFQRDRLNLILNLAGKNW